VSEQARGTVGDGRAPADADGDVTRRGMLATAGGAAAGVLALGLPEAAEAGRRGARGIGAGPTDRNTVRFVGHIDQNGIVLTGHGYLTAVRSVTTGQLYTRPPGKTSNDPRSADPSAARFTFATRAEIQSMSAVGEVLSAVARGEVRIYYQPQGGGRFEDPGSFARGTQIAHFVGDFQNDLSVDGPNQGSVAMSADLTQRTARRFTLGGSPRTFGASDQPWHMRAAGRARRTDAAAPRATLSLSGELGVVDARS
jgi:hypothetical protein